MRKDTQSEPLKRTKSLILIRHELPNRPYLEHYAAPSHDCRILNVPFVGTNTGEILAEQLVESQLPQCFRDLWRADYLGAHSVVTLQRPSEVIDRYNHLQILRGLDGVERRFTAEPEEVMQWA